MEWATQAVTIGDDDDDNVLTFQSVLIIVHPCGKKKEKKQTPQILFPEFFCLGKHYYFPLLP